jgi:hypothetical protein
LRLSPISRTLRAFATITSCPKSLSKRLTQGECVPISSAIRLRLSCLNDATEVEYGRNLFQKTLTDALATFKGDDRVKQFVARYLMLIEETASASPIHLPSPFFLTCFCAKEDDLSTWRAYGTGQRYAIAFQAQRLFNPPNHVLLKVNYDTAMHKQLAAATVEATINFYSAGLQSLADAEIPKWDEEFIAAWESKLTYLLPLVKDGGFEAESEFRILHEFRAEDLKNLVVIQKQTMMTRHVPISFPLGGEAWVPRLPIEKVMIGPCEHPDVTRISVDTLLRKMGYGSGKVVLSSRPFRIL